jgi:hypothetical protein
MSINSNKYFIQFLYNRFDTGRLGSFDNSHAMVNSDFQEMQRK